MGMAWGFRGVCVYVCVCCDKGVSGWGGVGGVGVGVGVGV